MKIAMTKFIPYLLIVLAQIFVGVNITGSKFLVAHLPIFFLITIRFMIATTLLFSLYWLLGKGKTWQLITQLNRKDWFFAITSALAAGVLFNLLMVYGLSYTDANVAGIITSALPALVSVMACIFLKDPLTIRKLFCIGLATTGLLIIAVTKFNGTTVKNSLLGDLLVFASLIPEASYFILTRIHPNRLPAILMAAIINAINALVLLPSLLMLGDWFSAISTNQILVLLLISLASGMFYVLWYSGCHRVDPSFTSLSTAIVPLSTIIIAWLTLEEIIDYEQLLGMAFVFGSIIAYAMPPMAKSKHTKK